MTNICAFRRVKVLLFVILLSALHFVSSANKFPDLVHLSKTTASGNEELCVAFDEDAYTAIEWSYPIPENEAELPKTTSSYFPRDTSSYQCDFEEDNECNKIWNLANWTRPFHTPRNHIPIADTRWENFTTYWVTNETTVAKNRVEVPMNSSIGFSIRSGGTFDVLLCEGFHPESHPCYKITLGGNTSKMVSIERRGANKSFGKFEGEDPILSPYEWKNFNLFLSNSGEIHLQEINEEIAYLNVTDPKPLHILYFFVNSSTPALWKIHKNYFLSTNVSQVSKFGPEISMGSSKLCLSMYLMMCKECSFYLFTNVNATEKPVFEKLSGKDVDDISFKWKHFNVIINNINTSSMQLYAKTNSSASDRFWAVDNIRICNQNEFKMRTLVKNEFDKKVDVTNVMISCHSLAFPKWSPKLEDIPNIGLPILSKTQNATNIQLHWKSYPQPFVINYKGSDICRDDTDAGLKNIQRLKSNGWIIVRPKESTVSIKDLVPYTHYDVTFIDPIYRTNKTLSLNTTPNDKLTKEEIPTITITPREKEVTINILPRKCNVSYGPIVCEINIGQGSQPQILTDTYTWKKLEPYTNYTLTVKMARAVTSLNTTKLRIIKYYNFTTKPTVTPPPESVQLCEIGKTFALFRYKLPIKTNGIPLLVQVLACNPLLARCMSSISNITHCKMWPDLYCAKIEQLMPRTNYSFKVSIKNNNTNAFGEDVEIVQKADNVAPGMPMNISYSIINCSKEEIFCNMNVSWLHPYDQRGVIRYFKISLVTNNTERTEETQIKNEQYLQSYWHVIERLSYSDTYNMSIQGCNDDRQGLAAIIEVKIDHIDQHINQTPNLLLSDTNSVTFQIPKLDFRLNSSTVVVVVQEDKTKNTTVSKEILSLAGNDLCSNNTTSWIAGAWKLSRKGAIDITVGNKVNTFVDILNGNALNKPLTPYTSYCFNFIFKSVYNGIEHRTIYHKSHIILEEHEAPVVPKTLSLGSVIVLTLLTMLLISVIIFGIVFYRKNRQRRRLIADADHIYEAMPDDEPSEQYNVVYNAVYDKLSHD